MAPFPSEGQCTEIPEVFVARDGPYPLIGIQSHPEQPDFSEPTASAPRPTLADPRLFLFAAWEEIVDSYLAHSK